jgi:hypothetical protein
MKSDSLLVSVQRQKEMEYTDFYQLGYKHKQIILKAVSQFNKIINGKDFVAQNAY